MHVLFVHQSFPAQFGEIAKYLVARHGWRCSFLTKKPPAQLPGGLERSQYQVAGGATWHNHFCTRTFENAIRQSLGVAEALGRTLDQRPDVRPDLIVGHSGFGSTLFLRDVLADRGLDVPIVNDFEYFYRVAGSDLDFRPDTDLSDLTLYRVRARNAMPLLDLDNCDAGYCPTHWQRNRFPDEYRDKLDVIFDGVNTELWHPPVSPPDPNGKRSFGRFDLPPGVKVVTYVSRGLESMRGFDVFMKTAKRLCGRRADVRFVVVGADRVCYGGDAARTGGKTYKQWILEQDDYDLSRFFFTGLLPPRDLADLFRLSDLHVYLSMPFVLSWSLLNASACGAAILASDTPPVQELVADGVNGRLVDFFDAERLAEVADEMLSDPDRNAGLREAAVRTIRERYEFDVCGAQVVDLCRRVAGK